MASFLVLFYVVCIAIVNSQSDAIEASSEHFSSVNSTVEAVQRQSAKIGSHPTLAWSNLRVSIGSRNIIDIIPGSAPAGRLLGILGPSGCGKTTFLRTVSSKTIPTEGSLHYRDDSSALTPLEKRHIAFVHQDDSFFPMLTVRETLDLAGRLRYISDQTVLLDQDEVSFRPKGLNMTVESMLQTRIDKVVSSLGLTKVVESMVGSQASTESLGMGGSISGGERKRLAVACELLGNPRLLIADEPTSGLDSFQAHQVVQLLHRIARSDEIIVICTIHQPRSSIWKLFDDVMLLTPSGQVAYHGPRDEALEHFADLDYPCPENTNPAEHLIDLVSLDVSSPDALIESKQRISNITPATNKQSIGKDAYKPGVTTDPGLTKVRERFGRFPPLLIRRPLRSLRSVRRSLRRLSLLFGRALRQSCRDRATNLVRVGTSALLASVVGRVYGWQGTNIKPNSISDRVNIIAQGVINVAMLSVIKTLQLFKRERGVIGRERQEQQYTALEYLLAKSLAELPLDSLVAASFGLVLHWMTGMHCDRSQFVGLLALLGSTASSLGLAISAMAPSGDVALAIGPAIMVVYLIMGSIGPAGISSDKLPFFLLPFRWFSPMKWACEGLIAAEFGGQMFDISDLIPGGGRRGDGGSLGVRGLSWIGSAGKGLLAAVAAPRSGNMRAKSLAVSTSSSIAGAAPVVGDGEGSCRQKKRLPAAWALLKTAAVSHLRVYPDTDGDRDGDQDTNKRHAWGENTKLADGDGVIEGLGIAKGVSYRGASVALTRMLVAHLAIALLGLTTVSSFSSSPSSSSTSSSSSKGR